MNKMNEGIARNNVNYFPGMEADGELNYLGRRLSEAGIIEMAPSTKPPGFFVNWTTVTSLVVVVSAIVGLWYFTWQAADNAGFERGRQASEQKQLLERLQKTEEELRRTKDLKLVQAGQNAGHEEKK
jgi:hypothetical protein